MGSGAWVGDTVALAAPRAEQRLRSGSRHNGAPEQGCRRASRRAASTTCSLSWDPPRFNADKLSVQYLDASSGPTSGASLPGGTLRRRYTLTHNDLTGELTLSVGREYNAHQVTGWYTRLFRDEVLAEWAGGSLHVHVHIRGSSDWWLAPAQLRSAIFRREMPLVLDTVSFAERQFLATQPALADAPVLVHFHRGGHTQVESWGCLSCLRGAGVSVSEHQRQLAHACSPPVGAAALQQLQRQMEEGTAAAHAAGAVGGPAAIARPAPSPFGGAPARPAAVPSPPPFRGVRPSLMPVAATARASAGSPDEVVVGHWSRQHPRQGNAVRTRTT